MKTNTEIICPRCHRTGCATATELYMHIVGDAQGGELAFWAGHFALTAQMLFVRG